MPTPADPYELIYWPSIPGRAEHIRLLLEAAAVPYTDHSLDPAAALKCVQAQIAPANTGDPRNPPPLAPPILRHGDLLLSQTSNILLYLGPKHGLAPEGNGLYHVNGLALTALDGLSNEAHDTHHPIASGEYYEDQAEEAKRKAKDYRSVRLPKFLGYFERVLKGEKSQGWLYGDQMTYADLVLFQCLDGVKFAFPKTMEKMEKSGKYVRVFKLYEAVKEVPSVKDYLASGRRKKYSMGIYRHYPELEED